ncbi:unnamed protein product [Eruca vesicaria subsp. sativa]|uniref:Plastid lipid-associated protein/fibrillin conserved domain-containing protein n=1 Tax=Eruca vesicaria subsp. sativa TaxID=29727 RepID=A0ABC8J4B1_ERUVS|nr:unnamed protein product [Eruca vesicaria subsp. sativa]
MALTQHCSVSVTSAARLSFSSSASPPLTTRVSLNLQPENKGQTQMRNHSRGGMICKAMVQEAAQAIPSLFLITLCYSSMMLVALRLPGKITDMQKIDVNKKITIIERLNPTPRPTTFPYLEGRWSFEWFGSNTPGSVAARVISERFPSSFVSLSSLDIVIKDASTRATANVKLLNMMKNKVILTSKFTVEGLLRMREEYLEGMLESPTVIEEAVPEQLRGLLGQATTTLQQLPEPVKDTFANGLRIPLGKPNNKPHF